MSNTLVKQRLETLSFGNKRTATVKGKRKRFINKLRNIKWFFVRITK